MSGKRIRHNWNFVQRSGGTPARQKVNQGLAEAVGWKGDWNTGSDEASARIFRNWVYDYSLVLDFTSKAAYLTRLH